MPITASSIYEGSSGPHRLQGICLYLRRADLTLAYFAILDQVKYRWNAEVSYCYIYINKISIIHIEKSAKRHFTSINCTIAVKLPLPIGIMRKPAQVFISCYTFSPTNFIQKQQQNRGRFKTTLALSPLLTILFNLCLL